MSINSKEQREEVNKKAVEIRESGDKEKALEMFLEVEKWDEENKNIRGQVDVLGHLRIIYVRLADVADSEKEREELRKKAMEVVDKALSIAKEHKKEISKGQLAITKVHLVSAQISYSKHFEGKEKETVLEESLKILDGAIKNLPGSKAHKAWPLRARAEVLVELNRTDGAFEVLLEALRCLHEGYRDEIENDDQAELKLNVWVSGIYLTLALICQKEEKYILARYYANSILNLDDLNNYLGLRKETAKKILSELPK